MKKHCTHCGSVFYAEEDWKKLCIPCWKKSKGIDDEDDPFDKHDHGRYKYKYSGYESPDFNKKPEQIPKDMINRLIRLCHPDKHNNSESSNEATKWLLQQRDKG